MWYYFYYREVLYTLVQTAGLPSFHDVITLRKWVHFVGDEVGVPLKAT